MTKNMTRRKEERKTNHFSWLFSF